MEKCVLRYFLVKRPKTFHAKDTYLKDGEAIPLEPGNSIRLQCNFRGTPVPKVFWYKNEKMIVQSNSHRVEGQRHLKIRTKR